MDKTKSMTYKPRGTSSILSGQSSGVHPNPCKEIYMREYNPPKFMKLSEADVDGAMWYTLFIEPEVMLWLKSLNSTQWTYVPGGSWRLHVDVHEHLYAMLVLRWT